MRNSLTPKLFTVLKSYSKAQFYKDCAAGTLVGIIAFPVAIAIAVSSGVNPEMGLNTAVIGGFLISFLGGSRVQIGGPTVAFVPIVFNVVNQHGVEGLVIATFMAGILLILMGFFRFGVVIKYVPYPVITGFTSGIAIAILLKQVKELLGLTFPNSPNEFFDVLHAYLENFNSFDVPTCAIGGICLLIILSASKWPFKLAKYIPASLMAIIISAALVHFFSLGSVTTVGSKYANLHVDLFTITLPKCINLQLIKELIEPAFTIAILAGVESLLSAVIADGMIGGHHRSNAELVGQGVANVFSACFGGIPATAAIARTATNIRNGGRSPIAGMVHALTVLLIMLVCMPLAQKIPLTCLAAILIVVAYHMGEWQVFRDMSNAPKSDTIVFLATFIFTVIFDLTIALKFGLFLAAILFIKRMGDVTEINQLLDLEEGDELEDAAARLKLQKQLGDQALLYEIRGPFFFGAVDKLADTISKIDNTTKLIIIKMHEVPVIDSTGYHSLKTLYKTCKHNNIAIYFTHLRSKPLKMLTKSGFVELVGSKHFCKNISSAIKAYTEV